jgi:hypothetical protein
LLLLRAFPNNHKPVARYDASRMAPARAGSLSLPLRVPKPWLECSRGDEIAPDLRLLKFAMRGCR